MQCHLQPWCNHTADAHIINSLHDRLQERLRSLFSGLADEMGPGLPSFFEWAFACVRSRAFQLGEQRYAFVPFLDIANHSPTPNAGFR